jgi:hypothetical protein
VGESLANAVPEADGGYRDRTSAPAEGSGISFPMRVRVVQGRQLPQALGAYSVPSSDGCEGCAYHKADADYLQAAIGRYAARLLAARREIERLHRAVHELHILHDRDLAQLRAALSEALAAAGV